MGKKMLVSLALEGKLANHGLTATEQDDDVLTALARELVTEQGIGERAAAVWQALKQNQAPRLPHPLSPTLTIPAEPPTPVPFPERSRTLPPCPAFTSPAEQLRLF
jgi:hypothetical protein